MAFCQNCGSPVEGRFCAGCGAAVGQDVDAPPASPLEPKSSTLPDNLAGALCYLAIGIVLLLIEPYNRNKTIRFHAFQALFLFVASWVVNIVLNIFAEMMGLFFFLPIIHLGVAAVWLFMMFKTYNGEKIVLPVIGPIAEKQA